MIGIHGREDISTMVRILSRPLIATKTVITISIGIEETSKECMLSKGFRGAKAYHDRYDWYLSTIFFGAAITISMFMKFGQLPSGFWKVSHTPRNL